MDSTTPSEILVNIDIKTYPCILYPSLEKFLTSLNTADLNQGWSEQFFKPLKLSGVRSLDDMIIVSPQSLHVFYGLPPITIMDFYAHALESIELLHVTAGTSICVICQSLR
ncbi:hypothetical protein PAXRUDRAFT_784525 [Paxillus rubicundulus Ve08.2h10]|uniref:Uncharacterized protein n=1 Tax=Paxillus rubicundulus Ve08.2h10 TaxID=930991 RepID=A0A0D0D6J5_9AGAM|nr:hypothetical protein PAXRUDRAFT_784525 [Paxillus rubicundulus Ve08.2h10]